MSDRKAHNRKQTIDGIQQAIEQLQASQGKLSISAVANMAGVTPALIHNTYPDLAEKHGAILYRSFLAGMGKGRNMFEVMQLMQDDGLHPNAQGVEAIVDDIGPVVLKLVAEAREGAD